MTRAGKGFFLSQIHVIMFLDKMKKISVELQNHSLNGTSYVQ
jgi:hypothetical protein